MTINPQLPLYRFYPRKASYWTKMFRHNLQHVRQVTQWISQEKKPESIKNGKWIGSFACFLLVPLLPSPFISMRDENFNF